MSDAVTYEMVKAAFAASVHQCGLSDPTARRVPLPIVKRMLEAAIAARATPEENQRP